MPFGAKRLGVNGNGLRLTRGPFPSASAPAARPASGFSAAGAVGHFLPVLTLHAVLLPLNAVRLAAHLGRSLAARVMAASVLPAEVAPVATRDDDFPSASPARRHIDA